MRGMDELAKRHEPDSIDTMVGDVRVHAGKSGLIGLYRGDEAITLVASEAVGIARLLLERFASRV